MNIKKLSAVAVLTAALTVPALGEQRAHPKASRATKPWFQRGRGTCHGPVVHPRRCLPGQRAELRL